ncbi:MAG: metallophosphoesterase family protein [Myxococcota bacterium]
MTNAPVATPIGFISDVHGHADALEQVLEELRRRDVQRIYAAGDHLLGGPTPLETWRALQRADVRCTRGLSDEALVRVSEDELAPASDAESAAADEFLRTRKAIGELVIKQLRELPLTIRIPLIDGREVVMVHGSPADPFTEIAHDVSDDELRRMLDQEAADVVVCGASHVPFRRDVDGITVLSLGSVGQSPGAKVGHFTVLRPRMDGLEVHQDFVEL